MAKQNAVEQTQARIKELIENKTAELLKIQGKVQEARTQKEAADLAMREATESMNLVAYEKAKEEKKAANTAIEMYTARYKMLEEKDFVTEADSDATIAAILAYEEEMAASFDASIIEPLKTLEKLLTAYKEEVKEAERTITEWTSTIHANYISKGTTYADGTHRSPKPVPVHSTGYEGSAASIRLKHALEQLEEFMEG